MSADLQYSRLDIAFSDFLAQRSSFDDKQKNDFKGLILKLSFQRSHGHSCIYINQAERALVMASGLVSENKLSPLIVEKNRLYLHRYWFYENRLARQIKNRLTQDYSVPPLNSIISRYFTELVGEIDWQKKAAIKTLTQTFSIITGGPGTGKTTAVVKILALLQEIAVTKNLPQHIALAAPTGKAAMRLQESIGLSKNTLPCSEAIKKLIPETVTTLHQLLGSQPPSVYFKHDAKHPLTYDTVVVDEASMIDLALMSKLVDALKPNARLILLGDKDQLASVESGSVLADLTTALPEYTVEFKKSYRFQGDIKRLAESVNTQAYDEAWKILEKNLPSLGLLQEDIAEYASKQYEDYLLLIEEDADFTRIFVAFKQFQILCSNRYGTYGVLEINKHVEKQLARQNKIHRTGLWYVGRPIMITENSPRMQLYNGDIGICLYDKESASLAVFFLHSDGNIKTVPPSRLPTHEVVFAMTIHKSQGSEFEACLCVLPDKINPVLSKELIYTAITRAKTKLKIRSNYSVFRQALQTKVERNSGLYEKIIER